ncbi:MAG: hypothetical protein GYB65_17630 [Chloroflexi bacterium]|nr:hypothetical protein [Chloroflexota bacterium]
MFQHSRRGTFVWLVIVGTALLLALIAGGLSPLLIASLVAAYLALLFLFSRNVQLESVVEALPNLATSVRRPKPTEVAREATARARSDPDYDGLITLLDIGLVVDEQRPDGLSLRRGRFISLDDEGIRPFAIIDVPEVLNEQLAHFRFEIRDENGKQHYVYEMEKWLQAGQNHLLPNYRFPVRKNASELDSGAWTVRVTVDAGLLGVHNFSLSPSLAARRRMLSSDGEIRERVWRTPEDDESLPLSLEELLRQQSREQRQS